MTEERDYAEMFFPKIKVSKENKFEKFRFDKHNYQNNPELKVKSALTT